MVKMTTILDTYTVAVHHKNNLLLCLNKSHTFIMAVLHKIYNSHIMKYPAM